MKRGLSGGAFLAAAILACATWLFYYSSGEVARAADRVMQDEVARGNFSGVALIARDGKNIFEKAYGLADVDLKIPNTTSTKFRIGSISKSFTAILVLRLEQQGALKLQNSVCVYIGECPAGWDSIELHHLLSHTSGIHDFTDVPDLQSMIRTPQSRGQILARFMRRPLAFAPGEQFSYSNSNFFLLALVIEKAAGQPFEAVLQAQILTPLGMHDTGIATLKHILPERARGYVRDAAGELSNDPDMHESWSTGAGALYSTASDLGKLSEALSTDKLLPRAVLERMWRPVKDQYGYGWQTPRVSAQTVNRRAVEHAGRNPGFVAMFRRFVDDGLTVIVLSNRLDADPPRVVNALSAVAFGETYKSVFDRTSVPLPQEFRRSVIGDYEFEGRRYTIAERDGKLVVLMGDAPPIEILAESSTELYFPGSEVSIAPIKNDKGEISGLAVTMNGTERIARKVR